MREVLARAWVAGDQVGHVAFGNVIATEPAELFYELHAARPNVFNTEAIKRIAALYKLEEHIRGMRSNKRRAYRQARATPLLAQLRTWLSDTLATLSRESDTSRAIFYALNRWEALTRYPDGTRRVRNR